MSQGDLQEKFLALVLEANQSMNLTAVRDPQQARVRHIDDSLSLLGCADFRGKRVLDVGTGAGYPGMALKIAEPSIDLTLLDATEKKVEFLRGAARELGLSVTCVHERAELYAHMAGAREQFDIVVARGVAELSVLLEICLPFVRVGGLFLAMKDNTLEAAPATRFGGSAGTPVEVKLSPEIIHYVIPFKKIQICAAQYPRSWAAITKRPFM